MAIHVQIMMPYNIAISSAASYVFFSLVGLEKKMDIKLTATLAYP